jgi:methanogenic corrinoid protein MtbC1
MRPGTRTVLEAVEASDLRKGLKVTASGAPVTAQDALAIGADTAYGRKAEGAAEYAAQLVT